MVSDFRSFGRRRGRKLRPHQSSLFADFLPQITLKQAGDGLEDPRLDFACPDWPLNLEIGFGGGEYLFQRACLLPQHNFIGAEPYENGVAKLLTLMADRYPQENLKNCNIRLFIDDVRDLLVKIPNNCLARIDIPFPDPWPKARHHRRRLLNAELLKEFCRTLSDDGALCIATDHQGYLEAILVLMQQFPEFQWQAQSAENWRKPWYGIHTRYAEKALQAGRQGYYLNFRFKRSVPLAS